MSSVLLYVMAFRKPELNNLSTRICHQAIELSKHGRVFSFGLHWEKYAWCYTYTRLEPSLNQIYLFRSLLMWLIGKFSYLRYRKVVMFLCSKRSYDAIDWLLTDIGISIGAWQVFRYEPSHAAKQQTYCRSTRMYLHCLPSTRTRPPLKPPTDLQCSHLFVRVSG